jgi:hypothetical protein
MEDRYVMVKIEPELGSGAATVLHAVLDGHGGEVSCNGEITFKSSIDELHQLLRAAVLKLGVATLLGVAKFLKRVAKYINLEFFDHMAQFKAI